MVPPFALVDSCVGCIRPAALLQELSPLGFQEVKANVVLETLNVELGTLNRHSRQVDNIPEAI
jgi:hypothetical protein